jgi:hypothetical protein
MLQSYIVLKEKLQNAIIFSVISEEYFGAIQEHYGHCTRNFGGKSRVPFFPQLFIMKNQIIPMKIFLINNSILFRNSGLPPCIVIWCVCPRLASRNNAGKVLNKTSNTQVCIFHFWWWFRYVHLPPASGQCKTLIYD